MPEPRDIVIFSIGPVQSFITSARRTQDLSVGSRILSLLSQSACLSLPGDCELIFPVTTITMEDFEKIFPKNNGRKCDIKEINFPNHIVFTTSQGQGQNVASDIEKVIKTKWYSKEAKPISTVTPVRNRLRAFSRELWGNIADNQIKEFLEIYWVVKEWDGDEFSYSSAYRIASLGLESRKNLRYYPFSPQDGRKCSICGTRTALFTDEITRNQLRKWAGNTNIRKGEVSPLLTAVNDEIKCPQIIGLKCPFLTT